MLTTQDWLDAGYRRYDGRNLNNADFLLQKRFDDTEGKKYYIDVSVYEWEKYKAYGRNPALPSVSFQPEVQFQRPRAFGQRGCPQRQEAMTLNVTLLMNESSTIADVEKEVEAMWVFLGKPYYERFNEC